MYRLLTFYSDTGAFPVTSIILPEEFSAAEMAELSCSLNSAFKELKGVDLLKADIRTAVEWSATPIPASLL